MHASLKDLISVRDGQPLAAEAASHLAACGDCRAALVQLEYTRSDLRQLPSIDPPQHSWAAIEQQLRSQPAPTGSSPGWRATTAVALAALCLVLLLGPLMHWRMPTLTGAIGTPGRAAPGASGDSPSDAGSPEKQTVGVLVARSQQLEALLNGLPRPSVERAATSATIDELEARIEVLDLQLSSAAESGLGGVQTRDLWSQRVRLLHSLVSVRYAEQAARGSGWPVIATGDI